LLQEIAVPSIEQPFLGRVNDYLDRLAPEDRAKLFPRNGTSIVLITTAHPLDAEEQSQWRDQLAKRFGAEFTVKFNSEPALIAGAEITFPHAILRFNWRDSLAQATKELRGNGQSR
ncbi:MAG TPA: F0F1 ATP synthase subunit delta, partial [Candidatus Binataceae bacterium]|nr:F0F1 ATP synthase subunit delta [Candidatus Binataceae bacterium]